MTKPTISSIAPTVGHTGGRTVVALVGSGFREPVTNEKTVRVLFGGARATDVEVFGPDLIGCRTPIHDPGPVDVVVQHLGETPAQLVSGAAPFAILVAQTLDVLVDGAPQQLTIGAGDVAAPGAATALELAALLNRLLGARATVVGGAVQLRTDRRGASSSLQVTGGSAAAALGFPAGKVLGSATLGVIEEETTTLPAAYTFARPDLTQKMPPTLALEQLIIELRRQVHDNVHFATHTDFDEETGDLLNTTLVASMPAIIISGLELVDSPDRRVLGLTDEAGDGEDRGIQKAPADPQDMTMILLGVTENPVEALNLHSTLRRFFRKNGKLTVPVDPDVPADPDDESTFREYDLDWQSGLPAGVTVQGDNANVISVSGSVAIRGVPVQDMALEYSGALPAGAPPGKPHEATGAVTWRNEQTVLVTERKE